MIERGQDERFALESRTTGSVRGKCFGQNIEGDISLQPRVARAIDLTHSANADTLVELVDTETTAAQLSTHT
jgi:hypothetical protein